jgi:hypothetical protein
MKLPEVHYLIHKMPSQNSILSEVNVVRIPTPCFFKINFGVVLPSTPIYSKCFEPPGFTTNILYEFVISPRRANTLRGLTLWLTNDLVKRLPTY